VDLRPRHAPNGNFQQDLMRVIRRSRRLARLQWPEVRKNMNPTGTKTLEVLNDMAARVSKLIEQSPLSDLEKNAKQQLVSQLAKHGLVTREEYEIQQAMLERSQIRLRELEAKVAALESSRGSPAAG
jgi:BMFP domain-containing protein YqiC